MRLKVTLHNLRRLCATLGPRVGLIDNSKDQKMITYSQVNPVMTSLVLTSSGFDNMITSTRVLEVFVTLVGLHVSISCVEFIPAQKDRKAFPLGLLARRLQFISPINAISLLT